MEVRVLGPLEVREDDEQLALGGLKQRALLAILALHANEVVSTDRLIDELWGAEAPQTAAKSLQVHVSQLRKVLEPDRKSGEAGELLQTQSPGYLLRLDPDQLDVERFRRLYEEGREALADGDPETAADKLTEALSLWRGDPLADLTYVSFAQSEISRLEEMRLAALEDRIEADIQRGRHAAVIGDLERLISSEPLRERPRRQLMLALYKSGRQAEALAAYQDARRTLVDQLGIEPGKELRQLETAILAQDASLDPISAPPELPEEADESTGLFVGREAELEALSAGLDSAIAGRGSLFLLVGEPGIGKSRLAEEVTRQARSRGASVLLGRCWEAGGAPAFWPWVQSLRAYVEGADPETLRTQLAGGAADLAQIVPELHQLLPDLPEPAPETEGARFRLFDSAARFLRNAAAPRPLVIVLDDLHAADEPSLLLLRFVAGELGDSRILVVGTYRDVDPTVHDPLASTLAELAREQVTHRIELGGLTDADVARYIQLASGEVPRTELVAAIHTETEGNPLFVGEVARLLASEGRLAEVDPGALWTLGIPQGVREVIGRRLGRLSSECSRVLTLASVLGREVSLEALEGVSELSGDELLDLLDEAVEARVLAPVPGNPGRLRFGHALIRQTLYDQLTTPRRVQLHRRAGETLESLYERDPEPHLSELAYHFFEAAPGGDIARALDYARSAGDRAFRQLAYEEAARLYRMALDALELKAPPDEGTRSELLLALGDAEARGGDMGSAKRTFLQAAELARSLDEPEQLARAALGYGGRWVYARAGRDRRLTPLLESALAALPAGDNPLRAMLLARLAGALRDHPVPQRRASRASLTSEALEIARRLGDPRTLAYALDGSYSALSWPRDTDAWLAIATELMRLAEEIGDQEMAYYAHYHGLGAFMTRGEVDAADRELGLMREMAPELRQPTQIWVALIAEAMRRIFAGDLELAEEVMQRAAGVGSGAQDDATYHYVENVQGWALRREQGRLAELETSLESYAKEYPGAFVVRCVLASVYVELGREQQAREELNRLAVDDFTDIEVESEWFLGASALAEVCGFLEEVERAESLYAVLLPYAGYNVFAMPEVALGSASRPLGILAATMSHWEEAERHFERALEMNARMGTRPWFAHTQHDYGRMLILRGDAGEEARAAELLKAAASGYEELGMTSWQERAKADLSGVTDSTPTS